MESRRRQPLKDSNKSQLLQEIATKRAEKEKKRQALQTRESKNMTGSSQPSGDQKPAITPSILDLKRNAQRKQKSESSLRKTFESHADDEDSANATDSLHDFYSDAESSPESFQSVASESRGSRDFDVISMFDTMRLGANKENYGVTGNGRAASGAPARFSGRGSPVDSPEQVYTDAPSSPESFASAASGSRVRTSSVASSPPLDLSSMLDNLEIGSNKARDIVGAVSDLRSTEAKKGGSMVSSTSGRGVGQKTSETANRNRNLTTSSKSFAPASCVLLSDDDEAEEERVEASERNVAAGPSSAAPMAAQASGRAQPEAQEGGEELVLGEGRFRLSASLARGLYPHQRDGLQWMWTLHEMKRGGILGDDMGLGKTRQVASFLAGLFQSKLIKRVLIVVPTTLLSQWRVELAAVGLKRRTHDYTSTITPLQRDMSLQRILQVGGVLMSTYDMVGGHYQALQGRQLDEYDDAGFKAWHYVILDEGHLAKNPKTKRFQGLKALPFAHCLLLTGTPIQNQLKELWALFDICCEGLLGDYKEFKMEFENVITAGTDRNASHREKVLGKRAAERLQEKIAPFFLRRMKSEIFNSGPAPGAAEASASGSQKVPVGQAPPSLPSKEDIIVWLKLTERQSKLYLAFLQSDSVRALLNESRSPLAAITVLKKICSHPTLLTEGALQEIADGMEDILDAPDHAAAEALTHALAGMAAAAAAGADDDGTSHGAHGDSKRERDGAPGGGRDSGSSRGGGAGGAAEGAMSCKLDFLLKLLDELVKGGHRTLIFSQTRTMLDIIQDEVERRGYGFCRIDGSINTAVRENRVQVFQTDASIPVMLLTSQVGGLGLTLTGADRVIIVDPAWNPSVDNQSVDRAFRIGQKKDVVVYRLITAGTVEEKIYRKQIFKGGLMKIATEKKKNQFRYFSHKDLEELFRVPDEGFSHSETLQQLHEAHDGQHSLNASVQAHVAQLQAQRGVVGVSHHNLLFSREAPQLPDLPEAHNEGLVPQPVRPTTTAKAGWTHSAAAAAAPPARQAQGQVSALYESRRADEVARQAEHWVAHLWDQVARQERLLNSQGVTLLDGGAKVRAKIAELLVELRSAESAMAATRATAEHLRHAANNPPPLQQQQGPPPAAVLAPARLPSGQRLAYSAGALSGAAVAGAGAGAGAGVGLVGGTMRTAPMGPQLPNISPPAFYSAQPGGAVSGRAKPASTTPPTSSLTSVPTPPSAGGATPVLPGGPPTVSQSVASAMALAEKHRRSLAGSLAPRLAVPVGLPSGGPSAGPPPLHADSAPSFDLSSLRV